MCSKELNLALYWEAATLFGLLNHKCNEIFLLKSIRTSHSRGSKRRRNKVNMQSADWGHKHFSELHQSNGLAEEIAANEVTMSPPSFSTDLLRSTCFTVNKFSVMLDSWWTPAEKWTCTHFLSLCVSMKSA